MATEKSHEFRRKLSRNKSIGAEVLARIAEGATSKAFFDLEDQSVERREQQVQEFKRAFMGYPLHSRRKFSQIK